MATLDGSIFITSSGATSHNIPEYVKLQSCITRHEAINIYMDKKDAEWLTEKYGEELKFVINPSAKKRREEELENIIYSILKAIDNMFDMIPDGILKTALREEVGKTRRNAEGYLRSKAMRV